MIEHELREPTGAPCGAGSVRSVPLVETSPGVYETWWSVPADLPLGIYDVVGCLTVNGEVKAAQPAMTLFVVAAPPAPPAPLGPPGVTPPAGVTPPTPPAPPAPTPPFPPTPPEVPPAPLPAPVLVQPPGVAAGGPILGGFRTTVDDSVIIGIRSAGGSPQFPTKQSIAVTVAARLWADGGSFAGDALTVTPPTDRSINYYAIPLTAGYLESVTVSVPTANVHRGDVWVIVMLARGPTSSFLPYAVLAEGYPSTHGAIGWPAGPVKESVERPGRIYMWEGSNAVQGQDVSITVPAGAKWRILGFQAQLNTSGQANTRYPMMVITDPTHTFSLTFPVGFSMGANQQVLFSWARLYPGQFTQIGPAGNQFVGLPYPDVDAVGTQNQMIIGTSTVSLATQDNWNVINILLEELLYD